MSKFKFLSIETPLKWSVMRLLDQLLGCDVILGIILRLLRRPSFVAFQQHRSINC